MPTYANIAATVSRKEGRHQTALETAQKRGDRAGINAASRMLDRIQQFKDELYADQEAQKAPQTNGTPTFDGGGNTPYRLANQTRLPGPYAQPPSFNPFDNMPTLAGQRITPMEIKQAPAWIAPNRQPAIPYDVIDKAKYATSIDNRSQTKQSNATKIAQYAQLLPEALGFGNVARMRAPADAPQLDPTLINTSINTQAQEAALANSADRYNAGVDRGIASAPAAQALKLAGKMSGDTQMGQLLETKGNQERDLRNRQSEMLTNNRNQNRQISADNQNRQNDFANERIGLQQGLLNSAGMKVAAIGQENARMKLDKDSLALYSKMFDTGLLARNKFGDTIEELDPIVQAALDKDPVLKAQYTAFLKKNSSGSIGAPRAKDALQKDLNLTLTQNRLQAGVYGKKR